MTADDIVARFQNLGRGDARTFLHLLPPFEESLTIANSQCTLRTHFIAHDAGGAPAVDLLASAMANAALDFCIPRRRIDSAMQSYASSGSTAALVALDTQARELFVKSEKAGEGGELLLFLLMERLLGFPQLLSKMSLKTNTQVHVHGSDGIHAALNGDGVLDVYWGESKIYRDSSVAFTDCFASIAPFLSADGDERRRRDLLLVRDHLNVSEAELAAHLLRYFDDDDPHRLQVRWNGVCLVGFDYASYPNLATISEIQAAELRSAVGRWQAAIGDRLKQSDLLEVSIDVFCVPVPNVAALRSTVLKKLGVAS